MDMNLKQRVLDILLDDPQAGRGTVSKLLGLSEKRVRPIIKEVKEYLRVMHIENMELEEAHDELLEHSLKKEKSNQKLRDQQRIERKIRSEYRIDNAIEEYAQEIINILHEKHFTPVTIKHESTGSKMGVFCISDEHFNELIEMPHNQYDFRIASKRLKKYVIEAKKYFLAQGVTDVLVARLGDSVNSTRRMDELLNQATNRAMADVLAAELIEHVIVDLNENFNISVVAVSGNESRVEMEHGRTANMLTNNHDFTINEFLKIMFRETDIRFMDTDYNESVLNVNGKNILFFHGDQVGKGDVEKKVMQIKGKYAQHGTIVDYVVFGHIHSAYVADMFARSGSLCGSNAYSEGALQLSSRASQIILMVDGDSIDGVKVDLQDTGDIEGYPIDEKLEAYNAKSAKKVKDINQKYFVVGAV
jgi:predicted phosphodiesterase/ribosomal protein S19